MSPALQALAVTIILLAVIGMCLGLASRARIKRNSAAIRERVIGDICPAPKTGARP